MRFESSRPSSEYEPARKRSMRRMAETFLLLVRQRRVCSREVAELLGCKPPQALRYLKTWEEVLPIESEVVWEQKKNTQIRYFQLSLQWKERHGLRR